MVAPGVGVASAAAEGRQGAQEEALAGDVHGHPHLRRRPSTWAASCDSYGCGPGDASNPHPPLRQRPSLGLPGVTRTAQARVMPQTPKALALRTLNPNSRDSKSLATTGARPGLRRPYWGGSSHSRGGNSPSAANQRETSPQLHTNAASRSLQMRGPQKRPLPFWVPNCSRIGFRHGICSGCGVGMRRVSVSAAWFQQPK